MSRRLGALMFFRIVLITIVLGATTFVYWLEDADLGRANAKFLYGIIALTYFLTLLYALAIRLNANLKPLAWFQLAGDIVMATLLLHVTGGPQSAYSFFFPLSIISAAVILYRKGAIYACVATGVAFSLTVVLGWKGIIPPIDGQPILPTEISTVEFGRSLSLNLAAIVGMGALAINLGTQLDQTSVAVEAQKSVAADIMTLHRDIVHSLASGVITTDRKGRVSSYNEAAKDILGIPPDVEFRPPLHKISKELETSIENLKLGETLRRGELTIPYKGENKVLGISITPLVDHKLEILGRIINFQDLSDMKRMEDHMQRSERLAVIGGLAAGVAHEIRNPLASISGSIELLGSLPDVDDENKALMNIVTREIDRLNVLITELLDYTNPKALQKSEIKVGLLIQDILSVIAQDENLNEIHIHFQFENETPENYDKEKLQQALWNLIKNAAEAASEGGKTVSIKGSQTEEWTHIEIADTGPGIPEDKISRIFDPFFTTKAKGTGLGLATAHGIILEHGGTLVAKNMLGQGAAFFIQLPKKA